MDPDCIECECTVMKSGSDENEFNCAIQKEFFLSKSIQMDLEEHYPNVLELIKTLRRYIEKQQKKISKLKRKLGKRTETKNVYVQTCTNIDVNNDNDIKRNVSEEIKEAAEMAMQNTGFVYEETSGLYYDYNSGYYYNAVCLLSIVIDVTGLFVNPALSVMVAVAHVVQYLQTDLFFVYRELGLYYDGNSGTYMTYNNESQTYEFHSQVVTHRTTLEPSELKHIGSKRKKKIKNKDCKRERAVSEHKSNIELEEGECSDSSDSCTSQQNTDDTNLSEHAELSKAWPPCIRIIVKTTEVPKLMIGSLYIITYEGGTLGREGDHAVLIPDINISKHHLKFSFDKETDMYAVVDLGSRNGTLLNGKRMSASKQESDSFDLTHGSQIQIGSTVLLCHIHSSNETCDQCEPGLLQLVSDKKEKTFISSKGEQHKSELRKLRKKFAIGWSDTDSSHVAAGYTDRAQVRRETVGSHNEHEKTQVASVDQSIGTENKGFKLLSKMGWSEGQSLGKEGTGLLNPVELSTTVGRAGMGFVGNVSANKEQVSGHNKKWEKMQKRYNRLNSPPNDFDNLD